MDDKNSTQNYTLFCVKCQKFVPVNNLSEVVTRNNRVIAKGTCSGCGTVATKIMGVRK